MASLKTLTINGTTYDVVPVVPADSITLLAKSWEGSGHKYSQVVEVPGVTPHTKVDLQPTSEQLEEFHYKILAFVTENNNGVITVSSIGDKPTNDYTIQITKTEIEGTGPIRGNTVGTTMPKPDWNQEDPRQADYILNKPYVSAPIVCEASGEIISVADSANAPLQGLTLYGKTVQNGTPTPSAPVPLESVGESIGVKVCGKNLIGDNRGLIERTDKGITYTPVFHTDGTLAYINVNGTATAKSYYYCTTDQGYHITMPKGATATVSGGTDKVQICFQDGVEYKQQLCDPVTSSNVKSTQALKYDRYGSFLLVQSGVTVNNEKICPQIEIGSTATAYEPYKPLQTMTATAEGGLHGIGEVKDEIDFARGVLIRRVQEVVLDGTENWQAQDKEFAINVSGSYPYSVASGSTVNCICSHYPSRTRNQLYNNQNVENYVGSAIANWFLRFVDNVNCNGDTEAFKALLAQQYANGTPVTVQYILVEEKTEQLSADELSAFAELHSNKPNTTAFNDSGAEMKLEYVADTKAYIDNKFNELALAILNNA